MGTRVALALLHVLLLPPLAGAPVGLQQKAALLALCDANGGASMCESSGTCADVDHTGDPFQHGAGICWRDGSNPCEHAWLDVTCEDGNAISSLSLWRRNIDVIPPEIGQLVSLKDLHVAFSQVAVIPPEIEQLVNLQSLYIWDSNIAVIPPEIGQLVNLQSLSLTGNHIAVIPPEIGQLVNLQSLDLSGNQIAVIPPEIGQLVNLQFLQLGDNQISVIPPEINQLVNLQTIDVGGPLKEGQSFTIGPYLAECPSQMVVRDDVCEACPPSEGELYEQPAFFLLLCFVPMALYALYRVASSTWRPSNRAGVECVVYSGGSLLSSDTATVSMAWAERLAAHLDIRKGEVKVDHAGTEALQPGDDVRINGSVHKVHQHHHRCRKLTLSEFDGLVGTVMEKPVDGDLTVPVSVHGKAGIWELPIDSLTLLPLFVDTPQETPAVCFCVTNEWASSAEFFSAVFHVLAMRNGVDILPELAKTTPDVLRGLNAGVVFILCGDDMVSHAAFEEVKQLFSLKAEQIVYADKAGGAVDDVEHVTQALNDLEHFLNTHRKDDEHLRTQEFVREAIENTNATKDALSSSNMQHVATHTSMLVRIVTMHMQQCFVFMSWEWSWPALLLDLRRWIGSVVLFDLPTITNSDCLVGGGTAAVYTTGGFLPAFILFLLCCSCCTSSHKRKQWMKNGDEAAAATAAHMANFGWAVYTLGSPVTVSGALIFTANVQKRIDNSPLWLVPWIVAVPLVVFVPLAALQQLQQAKKAGILHSRAFEARFGWLCSRYRADSICFAWELVMLEVRFVTMYIGAFGADPITGALVVIAITLCLFIAQVRLKPFKETAEEAAHWSSSNKMGTVGYISQLVVLTIGLLSAMLVDSPSPIANVLLSAVAVVALLIPLGLTAKAIALNKEAYASVATDMVSSAMNILHTEDASGQVGLKEQETKVDEV